MPKIEGLQGVKGFFGEIALVSTLTLRVCSVVKNSNFSEIFFGLESEICLYYSEFPLWFLKFQQVSVIIKTQGLYYVNG